MFARTNRVIVLRRKVGASNALEFTSTAFSCRRIITPVQSDLSRGRFFINIDLSKRRSFSSSGTSEDKTSTDADASPPPEPNLMQKKAIFIAAAVPMMGFGIMDNTVMILAGDFIDQTIGVKLGLATMVAAACGQVCSDFAGVCFGGVIDTAAAKMGLPVPDVTRAQWQMTSVKRVTTAGAACGVVFGCCLGMIPLLFMDLSAKERAKREAELDTIFRTVMYEGSETIGAERSSLFLVDETGKELWSRAAVGVKGQIRVPIPNSLVGSCAAERTSIIVEDAYKDPRFNPDSDKMTGFHTKSVMCVPVLHSDVLGNNEDSKGNLLAVVQFVNKKGGGLWTEEDKHYASMLARHVGIFLEQVDS
eukprot:TRINITY_DN74917_c0_g1_i1.p1 TRINITY_DN74917_c0_g1~~TRINITY_DN74917_c0_g1_i1.p1  ORF type:complete len:362 (+),score=55.00 TRINITY_DN74917_c0_g1_i1:103-1188(+)